jgi:hypothetical protein
MTSASMSRPGRKPRLVIVAPDLKQVIARGIAFEELFEPTMVQSAHPLADATRLMLDHPDVILTRLAPADSIVDVRVLTNTARSGSILFLAEAMPVRAPIARVIAESGDLVLDDAQPVAVIEATLIAMLATRCEPIDG